MKILQVIHGYPPFYMAGSEVYTWNLCRELARDHQVSVFTRVENPYVASYEIAESVEAGVTVRRINKPSRDYTFRDKVLDPRVDDAFRAMLRDVTPDVVHFGHLSHLSTQLPAIARDEFGLPTVLTIHDFWMFCFRGQLVRHDGSLCAGPTTESCFGCAAHCFKEWMTPGQIEEYRRHMRDVVDHFDVCLAPSRTVASFYEQQGVPAHKIVASPYGFDVDRIVPRATPREAGPLRFGFLGRVIPVKGVRVLLEAFHATHGPATLDLWGGVGGQEDWLKALYNGDERIRLRGGYHNGQIQEALDAMDVLVAPSLWLENSPLVIQEAMLAGVPVITSDLGGMAELVQDGRDGFLVPMGDTNALSTLLQRLMDDPTRLEALHPDRTRVRTIDDDARACGGLYRQLLDDRRRPTLPMLPAPRRVTFVTNPGLCNLSCPMCDTHSTYAPSDPTQLPLLDFDVVERTVVELAQRGLQEIIPSTMGEPLLYPRFGDLLNLAARTGVKVNLTTNGTFARGGVDHWAPLLLPVVSDVKFSVNGIDPGVAEAIMPGVARLKQLQSIQRYLQLKRDYEAGKGRASTVTLQVTFLERNLDELPRLLRWAVENGFDRFKGHHLWVTWSRLEAESLRRSPEAAARWNRMVEVLTEIAESERLPNGGRIRLDNVVPLPVDGAATVTGPTCCPFLGREAWIEADGSFQVCCCPSGERAAFGAFGNVHASSVMELWTSRRYRDFVAGWGDHPNCARCNMRRPVQEVRHA